MALTKVSFIVPTLNRKGYVERAVASCIAAGERVGTAFEVVVLDSQSDDGSWESLVTRFGKDSRVLLRQNTRGLGPTRSWLDGADFITGDIVTFIWSDDYVADTMLVDLLPPMQAGSDIVIGKAMIRDVRNDNALPAHTGEPMLFDPLEIIGSYYGISDVVALAPVSPACALFSRRAFDRWRELVVAHAEDDLLVRQLMWRRAIGPDVLLFLVALAQQQGPVSFVDRVVTQFSSHDDSISISSPEWLLRGGYLAARIMMLHRTAMLDDIPQKRRTAMLLRSALQAMKLARNIPEAVRGLEDRRTVAAAAKHYRRILIRQAAQETGWPTVAVVMARLAITEARRRTPPPGQVSMAALT